MRELVRKYSKEHPDHFLLDIFEEGEREAKAERKLDDATDSFHSRWCARPTRGDEESGKTLLSSSALFMDIYYLNKERIKIREEDALRAI